VHASRSPAAVHLFACLAKCRPRRNVDAWPAPFRDRQQIGHVKASKSIEGCLTSSNGSYTLGTLSGDLYQLENSGHDLRKYNGQEVRITGRVTVPHPGSSPSNALEQQYARLKVQKIKKVFDTCQ
jgi:hypothetical protein